ncbi:MAG: TrmB family transcriptional regulator [Candidatus Hodarchaeota archaeon]
MTHKTDSSAIKEFKHYLKHFKSATKPEANWLLHELLKRLGLTKYEIQAYVILIQGGELSVSEIVKKTGIPQPRAYDTLRNLVKYGLITPRVQITDQTEKRIPQTYKAFEPALGLENLFAFFTYAKDQALAELEKLSQMSEMDFESGIREIHGRDNIINIANLMIRETKYEIIIVARVSFLREVMDSLIDLSKINIHISCVSDFEEGIEDINSLKEGSKFMRIRQRKNISAMPYMIIDRSYALILPYRYDLIDLEQAKAQIVDNLPLIDTLKDHFFYLNWKFGKPISETQDFVFPRTFVNIVSALEEIDILQKKRKKPKITITGHIPSSGELISTKGEVRKIYQNWEDGIFTIFLRTSNGNKVTVGGYGARFENIAAEKIKVDI